MAQWIKAANAVAIGSLVKRSSELNQMTRVSKQGGSAEDDTVVDNVCQGTQVEVSTRVGKVGIQLRSTAQ